MKYKNQSIYQLYNKESDSVVILKNIDFNENLLINENIENNIIDQNFIFKPEFFIKFFIKFFNKNNKKIFNSSNSMSESVRNKAKIKKNVMKISFSQEEISIIRCEKSKKNNTC